MTTSIKTEDTSFPLLVWTEGEQTHSLRWRSENGVMPPKRVVVADDTLTADSAFRLASEGTGILWRGDFQNARQLLQALARRAEAARRGLSIGEVRRQRNAKLSSQA